MKIKTNAWLPALLLSLTMAVAGGASPALATEDGNDSLATSSPEPEYVLNVGNQQVVLDDGEAATFPMVGGPVPEPGTITPRASYPSNCGTLTVTASAGVYSWNIKMTCPATGFVGQFHITDLSSGLGGGFNPVFSFSGSAPTSKLHNHRYSGTLTGTADFAGVIVAHVVPNNTLYTYP